jgi:hypothetical protein
MEEEIICNRWKDLADDNSCLNISHDRSFLKAVTGAANDFLLGLKPRPLFPLLEFPPLRLKG